MAIKLSTEVEAAILQGRGMARLEGDRDSYVVMTLKAYRELSGVGTDEELAESLRAIEEGLADIAAGRTRPFRDVLAELSTTDEIPG
jgi:predicted transcriptional regulator